MDVDPVPLSILLAALLIVGFAIAAETSLTTASRSNVRILGEDGNGRAKSVDWLLRDPAQLLLTLLLLKTGGVLAAGAAVAWLVPDTLPLMSLLSVVVIGWVLLAMLQAMGRSWVQTRSLQIALALAPIMQGAVVLLWPVTMLVRRVGRQVGDHEVDTSVDTALLSEGGLRRLISAAEEEEPIEEREKEMIASILEMDETVAREVMVPRIDMVALPVETSLRDALAVIIEAGHSRIPVYEENIDQIVGFLYAKDVLKCFETNQVDVPIRALLRPPYLVPVSKKVNTLLREMQKDRVHIAMVVDEYGGIAGLVTIEDILEEIVGEIQDEYDLEEETYVQVLEPNRYLLNARLDLYSLAKLLDTELPEEDADTLGGLIYSELGHVPVPNESVEVGGWRFTVLSLEGRRIEEVLVEAITENEPAEAVDSAEMMVQDSASTQETSPLFKYSASD
ncbi:MAG: HlyC/CorC family transporter [Caldilineaceae bacterium]|nr:HlyC/CorC family transporter [Caldilineaceae bacterium]